MSEENLEIFEVAPCIILIKNAVENPQEVIDFAMEQSQNNEPIDARIYNTSGQLEVEKKIRNTKLIDISPQYGNDVYWWILAQKLWQYGDSYGKRYNISFSMMETPNFLWYKKNEGFYSPHMDSFDGKRTFSSILYLNTLEEGGETHFEYFNFSVKPEAGSLLMFPANFAYLHGAKKPVSEDKFAVVTWFNP